MSSYVFNTFKKIHTHGAVKFQVDLALRAAAQHIASLANKNSPIGANAVLARSFYGVPRKFGERVDVASRVEYGQYVEFGTKPHWAPFEPLRAWVQQKVVQGVIDIVVAGKSTAEGVKVGKRVRITKKRKPEYERKINSIAYAIQRKIAMKGTEPQFMLGKALQEAGVAGLHLAQGDDGLEYTGDLTPVIQAVYPGLWQKVGESI